MFGSRRALVPLMHAFCLLGLLWAPNCQVQLPSGVYSCRDGEPCPEAQFCHQLDNLCHATPEDAGTGPVTIQCTAELRRCNAAGTHLQRCSDSARIIEEQCDLGCVESFHECAVCEAGAKRCEGNRQQVCVSDGSGWASVDEDCADGCVDDECTQCSSSDAARCVDDNTVEVCSEAGVWQAAQRCEGMTPECHMGTCLVCKPGTTRCDGTALEQCSGAGWTRTVRKDVCGAHCDPGVSRCQDQTNERCNTEGYWIDATSEPVCVADQRGCAGRTPRACSEEGDAWIELPIEAGECGAECQPNARECVQSKQRACDQYGQWSVPMTVLGECDAACIPGSVRCLAQISQICNRDASGWLDQPPEAATCDCAQPAGEDLGEPCGSCGGTMQCDGTCSVETPDDVGTICGNCGGKIRCDGSCSIPTPQNLGEVCGSHCEGTIQCDGQCSADSQSSDEKNIISFSILDIAGTITAETINLTVPFGAPLTTLVPTLEHTGAAISPASGVAQNFANPVTYTVTAANGTTKQYMVTVTAAKNSQKAITAFRINGISGNIIGASISLTLPFATVRSALMPMITHTGKMISPNSSEARDFRQPVIYRVTAADDSTADYTVAVTLAPASTSKDILSFEIMGGSTSIRQDTISVIVPNGSNVSSLSPVITHTGVTVSPPSGIPRDFSSTQSYTVTAQDNSTKVYTVTVTLAPF
jgi:hypothetical protein